MKKEFTLVVEEKTFVNDKNETVSYMACCTVIGGETFRLSVKHEDKKLFKHLVKNSK